MELKSLMSNKVSKFFHSSRVNFPLVKISASWFWILGPFWVHFGSILGPFWVHSGSILGPFWVHSGSILGPFWVHFLNVDAS